MTEDPLVKSISESKDWFELRVLYYDLLHSLQIDRIHNAFFERIHYLEKYASSVSESHGLFRLKRDLEREVSWHFKEEKKKSFFKRLFGA